MNQFCFNDLYSKYKKEEIGRKEFEGLIFENITKDHRRFYFKHLDAEERNDFVSWLYPRIHSAIDSYKNTGASFEAYMNSMVWMSAKEYRTRKIDHSIAEYTTWAVRASEQYAQEEESEYTTEGGQTQTAIESTSRAKNPKQLLILTLKCYCHVSDDFLGRIAARIGIAKGKLKEMTARLQSIRAKRDEEIRSKRERVHCQFYRCMVYEKKLSLLTAADNKIAAVKMEQRLEKARRRLEAMRKRLAGISSNATNSQIATVTGLSKGTIDASLYNLKTKWINGADKSILN